MQMPGWGSHYIGLYRGFVVESVFLTIGDVSFIPGCWLLTGSSLAGCSLRSADRCRMSMASLNLRFILLRCGDRKVLHCSPVFVTAHSLLVLGGGYFMAGMV